MKRGPEFECAKALPKRSKQFSNYAEQICRTLKGPFHHFVLPRLEHCDLVYFSLACKQTQDWTKYDLNKSGASRLLEAVMQGNEAVAKNILDCNPTLLLSTRGSAQAYPGKIIEKLTCFQAALCTGDAEMGEMMKSYFSKLDNGQAIMESQFRDVFSNGIKAHAEAQEKASFDFNEVIEVVLKAPVVDVQKALEKKFDSNISLHKTLDDFREKFTAISLKEQSFNPYHFLKALEQYNAAFDEAGSSQRRELVWRQVVGFTQRFFPACWAQASYQSIYDIVNNKDKLERCIYPRSRGWICGVESWGLGFDVTATAFGASKVLRVIVRTRSRSLFHQFMLEKNIRLENLSSVRQGGPHFGVWVQLKKGY